MSNEIPSRGQGQASPTKEQPSIQSNAGIESSPGIGSNASDAVVGRLAPSPTGALHLGNARSFLLAWLSIRHRGGQLSLRIEDIDSPRIKPWARQSTIDDLHWLRLDWDAGPDIGGPHAPYVQTERMVLYRPVLDELIARELVYPCDCSRSEVAASASAPHEALEGAIYAGTCRHRRSGDAANLAIPDFAWRFRASDATRTWDDLVSGSHSANVATQLGDFIVAKGDGTPAYQLAVVVDDYLTGVNEVLRGDDLIPSTFRQIELLAALAWKRPTYAHVPLMIGPDGRRLAKRHGDTRLSWFREAGYSPQQLVGYLAWTAGLIDEPQRATPAALVSGWSIGRLNRQNTVVETGEVLRILDAMP